ncbi:hypothetical protein NMG60_11028816 [Bertholletia excelsa]
MAFVSGSAIAKSEHQSHIENFYARQRRSNVTGSPRRSTTSRHDVNGLRLCFGPAELGKVPGPLCHRNVDPETGILQTARIRFAFAKSQKRVRRLSGFSLERLADYYTVIYVVQWTN